MTNRRSLFLLALTLGGCGASQQPPAASATSAAAETGIAACDAFLTQFDACLARVPAARSSVNEDVVARARAAWKSGRASGTFGTTDPVRECEMFHGEIGSSVAAVCPELLASARLKP